MSKTLELARSFDGKPFGRAEAAAIKESFHEETKDNPALEALAMRFAELAGLPRGTLAPLYIRQACEIAASYKNAMQFVAEIEDLF